MINVEVLQGKMEEEYTQFITNNKLALFYCTLGYRELLKKVTKAIDCYLIAIEKGKIIGALPAFCKLNNIYGNVLNSLPWYGSNPGIVVDPKYIEPQKIKLSLLNAFYKLALERDVITSTIITKPFEPDLNLYRENTHYEFRESRIGMVTHLPIYSRTIDLDLMKIIHPKTRNQIRRAQKLGIKTWHEGSLELVRFIADLHRKRMITIGAPPKSQEFFSLLSSVFTYNRDYRIYVAEFEGTKIAALLLTFFSRTVEYFVPAIVPEYRHFQPLNLLIYNAMKDAIKHNFQYWNWGGTKLPEQQGVYHFKKRWGVEECVYYYYTHLYKDISKLLGQNRETIVKEYPYFYVFPFSKLDR